MKKFSYKKITLPVLIIIITVLSIFTANRILNHQKVETLILATGNEKGQYYAFGQALSKVVKKHNPKINIEVVASEGSKQNVDWLQKEKAQLAIVQSDTLLSPSIEIVSFLFPEVFHLLVRQEKEITSFSDLKGKKVALMSKKSGSYALFEVLSHHYGLNPSEFIPLSLSLDEAIRALETGEVDAMFQVIALGNPNITRLLQNPNIELVSIDQGAALQLLVPALENTIIPKGTYNGAIPIPENDLSTVGVRATLVTDRQIESSLIYQITRILYEARNELVKENVQAAKISLPNSTDQIGFAFHPGATTYYDHDRPSFIVEYAEPISLGMSVMVLCFSGLWQLRMWIQGKKKNRADVYNLQLIELIEKINQAQNLKQLREIQAQLWEIFEKVIVDLDYDRISAESFQSFTFPWNVALKSIHHRETLLSTIQDHQLWEDNSIAKNHQNL